MRILPAERQRKCASAFGGDCFQELHLQKGYKFVTIILSSRDKQLYGYSVFALKVKRYKEVTNDELFSTVELYQKVPWLVLLIKINKEYITACTFAGTGRFFHKFCIIKNLICGQTIFIKIKRRNKVCIK